MKANKRSPVKDSSLRNPAQSIDEQEFDLVDDKVLRKHQAVERLTAEAREAQHAAYDRQQSRNMTDGPWE